MRSRMLKSILTHSGALLDIWPARKRPPRSIKFCKPNPRSDALALKQDWERVGLHIHSAIGKVAQDIH